MSNPHHPRFFNMCMIASISVASSLLVGCDTPEEKGCQVLINTEDGPRYQNIEKILGLKVEEKSLSIIGPSLGKEQLIIPKNMTALEGAEDLAQKINACKPRI